MENDARRLNEALAQVRQAHRTCVAFYQRVLPLIHEASRRLRLHFDSWNPRAFKMPSRRSNPFRRYAWDNLPLLDVRFAFTTDTGEGIELKDYLLDIRLVTDSLLQKERKNALPRGPKGPDALKIGERASEAETRLDVYVFVPTKELAGADIVHLTRRQKTGYPEDIDGGPQPWTEEFLVAGCRIPLEELMHDEGVGDLVERIETLLDAVVQEQSAEL